MFWVFRYAHTLLKSLYFLSTLDAAHVRKMLGSLHLHNFNLRILEGGNLEIRLFLAFSSQSCPDP